MPIVSKTVYTHPIGVRKKRVTYTKRLFDQLAFLLPTNVSGGISTSPISYKHWHTDPNAIHLVYEQAAKNLAHIVLHLINLERSTGKYLHLDIEPEPDGLLENSIQVVSFFEQYLLPIATELLAPQLGQKENIPSLIRKHVTICYDICHFSLAYEEPEETFNRLQRAQIKIGKIQVSSALKVIPEEANMEELWHQLSLFDEPKYLHQVTSKSNGHLKTYADLPDLLNKKEAFLELRAHFHVPIFLEKFKLLHATQDQIFKVLALLKENKVSEHLEVETYTWHVLPTALKMDLTDSIVRELDWLLNEL